MAFSPEEYRQAVDDYEKGWQATDTALYDLCRRYPNHTDRGGVNAKLWIIGRTYATGIERKIRTNNQQGGSMSKLAECLSKHAIRLDALFSRLRDVQEPLDISKLRTIIDIHGQFIALIQPELRHTHHSPRSFASKYMHFHCRAVPIIDTFADWALRKAARWQKSFWLFNPATGGDEYYATYVFRFWHLYQEAIAVGVKPKVKHLDYFLLCAAASSQTHNNGLSPPK